MIVIDRHVDLPLREAPLWGSKWRGHGVNFFSGVCKKSCVNGTFTTNVFSANASGPRACGAAGVKGGFPLKPARHRLYSKGGWQKQFIRVPALQSEWLTD